MSPRAYTKRTEPEGQDGALYKKRGVLVEPVFGQVKEGQVHRVSGRWQG